VCFAPFLRAYKDAAEATLWFRAPEIYQLSNRQILEEARAYGGKRIAYGQSYSFPGGVCQSRQLLTETEVAL